MDFELKMIPNKHKQKRSACTAVLPVRGVLRCADPCADRCAAGWLHLRGAVRCAVRCAARCGALRGAVRCADPCADRTDALRAGCICAVRAGCSCKRRRCHAFDGGILRVVITF